MEPKLLSDTEERKPDAANSKTAWGERAIVLELQQLYAATSDDKVKLRCLERLLEVARAAPAQPTDADDGDGDLPDGDPMAVWEDAQKKVGK